MTDQQIKYYAISGIGRNPPGPSGLVRRRFTDEGRIDEILRTDMTWRRDTAIIQWEYGNFPGKLTEMSEAEATELIEKLRERWSAEA